MVASESLGSLFRAPEWLRASNTDVEGGKLSQVDTAVIATMIGNVVTPVVVLILGVMYRGPIRQLLRRARKAKLLGTSVILDRPKDDLADHHLLSARSASSTDDLRGSDRVAKDVGWLGNQPVIAGRLGNCYWLAYDIMWTAIAAESGAPLSRIRYGLTQALHHATELNLQSQPVVLELSRLVREVNGATDQEWTPDRFVDLARRLSELATVTGADISRLQASFDPGPHFR